MLRRLSVLIAAAALLALTGCSDDPQAQGPTPVVTSASASGPVLSGPEAMTFLSDAMARSSDKPNVNYSRQLGGPYHIVVAEANAGDGNWYQRMRVRMDTGDEYVAESYFAEDSAYHRVSVLAHEPDEPEANREAFPLHGLTDGMGDEADLPTWSWHGPDGGSETAEAVSGSTCPFARYSHGCRPVSDHTSESEYVVSAEFAGSETVADEAMIKVDLVFALRDFYSEVLGLDAFPDGSQIPATVVGSVWVDSAGRIRQHHGSYDADPGSGRRFESRYDYYDAGFVRGLFPEIDVGELKDPRELLEQLS